VAGVGATEKGSAPATVDVLVADVADAHPAICQFPACRNCWGGCRGV
jgi:hypothetical protein